MPDIKPLEKLEYSDDFMFNQVMQNDKICIGVLERLLKIKIDHIERVELQKEIKPYYQSKGIKLDVYVKDSNRVFDIDMQCKNDDSLPRRLRYYQSMIDANALIKGKKYKELNDSFIIFICKHDPVGENLPVYTYLESCQEDKSLLLNDGTHKFFFNAAAADNEKDVEIRAFLNYIKNGKASDDFTNEIDSIVEAVKQNEAVKELYMMKSILIQDAESEGEKKATIKAVHGLYKNNVSIEVIAKSLEITEEQVKKYLEQSLSPN